MTPSPKDTREELDALQQAKFDEICSELNLGNEEAEDLIGSWNESADNWDLTGKAQRLLAEHREIGERINGPRSADDAE